MANISASANVATGKHSRAQRSLAGTFPTKRRNNIFGNGFALFLQLFQFVNRMCDESVLIKYSSPQFGGIRVFIQWKMFLHLLRSNQSTAPDSLVLMHSSACNNDSISALSSRPPSARCSQQYRDIKIHIYGNVNEQRNANDAREAL